MKSFTYEAGDGLGVHCYRVPAATKTPRGLIHIAHGMGEHAARYEWAMTQLAAAGYHVTANDHRGHGQTAETLGDFGDNGVNRTLEDIKGIIESESSQYPELPVVLFGHSMGSMLSQMFVERYGNLLDALVLSGTPGAAHPFQAWLIHTIARFERWRLGDKATSALLQTLLFGGSNKDFDDEPDATGFEWLSRDAGQVKLYVDDPMCGFVPCPQSLCDLFSEERLAWRGENLIRIPTSLPVYLFSGDADPVHNKLKNIMRLLAHYRGQGLNVTTRFYAGGRHEMLNEINREEVVGDIVAWLKTMIDQGTSG